MRGLLVLALFFFLFVVAPKLAAQSPPAAPAAPTLTAEEQKDRDLIDLRAQLTDAYKKIADLQAVAGSCQGQLGTYQLRQNTDALKADLKALQDRVETRTGYAWDPATGVFGAKKPAPTPEKKQGGS